MPLSRMVLEVWDNEQRAFCPAAQLSLVMKVERTAAAGKFRVLKDLVFEYLPTYAGPSLDPWLPTEARGEPFYFPVEEGALDTGVVSDLRGNYRATLREYRHLPPTLFQFAMGVGASQRSGLFYFRHVNAFETWWLVGGLRRGALRLRPLPGGYLEGMVPPDVIAQSDPATFRHEAFLAQQPTSVAALATYEFNHRFLEYTGFAGECAKIPAQFDQQAWVVKVERSLDHELRRDSLLAASELACLNMARAAGLTVMDARMVQLAGNARGLAIPDMSVAGRLPEARHGEAIEPPVKNRVLSLHEIMRPLLSTPDYPSMSGYAVGWSEVMDELVRWLPTSRDTRDEMVRRYLMRQFLDDRQGDISDILLVSPAGETRWTLAPLSRLRNSGIFGYAKMNEVYQGGEQYRGEDPGLYQQVARMFSLPGLPLSEEDARALAQPLLAVVANWQSFYAETGADISAPEHQYTRFPGLRPPEVPPPPAEGWTEDWSLGWDDDNSPSP